MGPVVVLEGLGGQMPILIKPFLFLVAFGQAAILFASVIGLAGWLLTTLARAISVAHFRWLQVSARSAGPVPLQQPTPPTPASQQPQAGPVSYHIRQRIRARSKIVNH